MKECEFVKGYRLSRRQNLDKLNTGGLLELEQTSI